MAGIGQLRQQMTIETLSDDVLLKIFKFFIDATYCYYYATEEWHMLVHACRRWRNLAFTSPRHLNLQLLCRPPKRSVDKMLDVWPELPIYLHAFDCSTREVREKVAAVLRLNHRVFGIRLKGTTDSAWDVFGPLMQRPFPALTHLLVMESHRSIKDAFSRSFLGGSAPSLQVLHLDRTPLPSLSELLFSVTNLVSLQYNNIPLSGYISPQAMVTGLSALTRLESLSLTFGSCRDLPDRAIRISPPHKRTPLPALTYLRFRGNPGYMEDLVAQIDAPSLESMEITLFHERVIEIPQLAKFVRRADKLSLPNRAWVTFRSDCVSVTLSQESLVGRVNPKTLMLNPTCPESELRLSYLAQFCASCLPTFSPFECLYLLAPLHHTWMDVKDDRDPQWLELLRLFNTVKDLRLSYYATPHIAQALRGLPAEQVTEVLPALENVFISAVEPLGPVKDAILKFADARQLSGHPVSIYDWDGRGRVTRDEDKKWIDMIGRGLQISLP